MGLRTEGLVDDWGKSGHFYWGKVGVRTEGMMDDGENAAQRSRACSLLAHEQSNRWHEIHSLTGGCLTDTIRGCERYVPIERVVHVSPAEGHNLRDERREI